MRLTTRGRFAVTAMIDLATHQSEGPVTLATIAERQHISLSYLEQLFGKLRRSELVCSVRGPGGGYRLMHDMDQITVAQIIAAVDEVMDATQCGGDENCQGADRCASHNLWSNLNYRMFEYLDSVTLRALVMKEIAPEGQHSKVIGKKRGNVILMPDNATV